MKSFLLKMFAKYKLFILIVLKPLGIWGIGALAFIDSSSLAVPMDPIVAGYVWNDRHRLLLYCLLAAVGSALGSLVPFFIGRAGGELLLLKHINRARFEKMRDRFERQEFLAMMIPSMMPPPTPFKLFVFAAGIFEMRMLPFLGAVALGRFLRFLILSILVVRYGLGIVHVLQEAIRHHLTLTLLVFGAVVVALTILFSRQLRAGRKSEAATDALGPG